MTAPHNMAAQTKPIGPDELLARARALVPALAERAGRTESLRRLTDETMADLHRSGLLKILQPARFGGLDHDWSTHVRVGAELARGCGSTAWIQCIVGVHAWFAARLPLQGQIDIWGKSPDVLISTAVAGGLDSTVEVVEGGYVVSGRWKFASGVDHAQWVIIGAMPDDAQARAEHNWLELAIPKSDVRVIDTWDTASLRGTGSNDVAVDKVFVPTHRSVWRKAMRAGTTEGSRGHANYVHHVQFTPYFGSLTLGPILGTAMGALEAYVAATKGRIGHMRAESVAAQIPVQTRLSESGSEIRAAMALFERNMQVLDSRGRAGEKISKDEWVKLRADGAFIGKLCMAAVERIVKQMGAGGLTAKNPVRRFHADLMGMTAHISQQWDLNAAPFGAWALGLATDNQEINAAAERSKDLF
ncbi:MAG: acyl-CoA dehydrogenase family protein [Rhodospirillaceae bacterium]|nr:acyl-CoA dehydrogenase family protein [Rhodospirillaceae bacterium]